MSYQIADEPLPSETFRNMAFTPTAPLLAAMMCGAWLAWPWFIVNALALGSPTARREIQLCIGAFVGSVVLAVITYQLVDIGVIESVIALQLAVLAITGWKLGMAYYIATVQARTFNVYQYYGGAVQKHWPVLVVGVQVRWLIIDVSENPIWRVIVSVWP